MERPKYISIIVLLCLFTSIYANTYQEKIYDSYITNNMLQWKTVVDEIEKKPALSNLQRLELLNYQYGYIGWCIGQKRTEEAKAYLQLAEKHIDILENRKYQIPTLHAYKAAFYGYKIGLNPVKATYLGPKSIWHVKKSLQDDENNIFAHLQYGNIYYYMPAIFGGSKETAKNYYLKVEKHYQTYPKFKIKNWNYINLLITLTNTYIALNQHERAMEYFTKIKTFEPNCVWIESEILPLIKN